MRATWADETYFIFGADTFTAHFGVLYVNLCGNEHYIGLKLVTPPSRRELRELRRRFFKWAAGKVIYAHVDQAQNRKFAAFFGLTLTEVTPDGVAKYEGRF